MNTLNQKMIDSEVIKVNGYTIGELRSMLKELLGSRTLRSVAKQMKLSHEAVRNFRDGKYCSPDTKTLDKIAVALLIEVGIPSTTIVDDNLLTPNMNADEKVYADAVGYHLVDGEQYLIKYDENGVLKYVSIYAGEDLLDKTTHHFDAKGRVIKVETTLYK